MAYTSISNTAIDQDSPITVSLITALRDNPIAIANGDSGAPKVQTAGINDSAVTSAKINNGAVTNTKIGTGAITVDKFAAPTAASTYTLRMEYFDGDAGASHSVVYTASRAGGYRIRVTGDSSSSLRVLINGSLITTLTAYTSTEQTYDVTLAVGDELTLNAINVDAGDYVRVRVSSSQPFNFFLCET